MRGAIARLISISLFLFILLACTYDEERLIIFYDSALSGAMEELIGRFEKIHPEVKVEAEPSEPMGAVCKVIDLRREVDLVISDPELIERMLMPRKLFTPSYADWLIKFAADRLVIAYADSSRYAGEINAANWREVLSRRGVRIGCFDTARVPMIRGLKVKRYEVDELTRAVGSGDLDYALLPLSAALRGELRYIDPLKGDAGRILYAATIPKGAPHLRHALMFLDLLLGEEGRRVLRAKGYQLITPAEAKGRSKVPRKLRRYVGKG